MEPFNSSFLSYGLFFSVLFLRLIHEFSPIETVFMSIFIAFLMRLLNRGSFIIKYEDASLIIDRHRILLEIFALILDEAYKFNYGLQLILFGRFVDVFIFSMKMWPYIKSFLPYIQPMIEHFITESMMKPVEIKQRRPIYTD